jgi:hypothetical protein
MERVNIRELTQVTKNDRDNAVLFQILSGRDAGPPATIHPDGRLPAATRMRLQRVSGDMALVVASIGAAPLVRDVEGWVRCVEIEAVLEDRQETFAKVCGERQGFTRVVPDEFFDRPAPTDEARNLREFHPCEGHGHHGRRRILFSHAFRKPIKFADVTPAAQERHADVPAVGERTAEPCTGKECVDRGVAVPRRKHHQVVELHPLR